MKNFTSLAVVLFVCFASTLEVNSLTLQLPSLFRAPTCEWTDCQRPKPRRCPENTTETGSSNCIGQIGWKRFKCCANNDTSSCQTTECYPDFTPGCPALRVQDATFGCTAQGWTTYHCCPQMETVPRTSGFCALYNGTSSGTTASGQQFDQNALTGAHASLPFGTRLTVKNEDSWKTVQISINDRPSDDFVSPSQPAILYLTKQAFSTAVYDFATRNSDVFPCSFTKQ